MISKIKNLIANTMNPRIVFAIILIASLFLLLVGKLFYIQIIKGDEYSTDHKKRLEKSIIINGQRGNIYDKNGKLIAYNNMTKSVTINSSLITGYKNNEEYNTRINSILLKLIDILDTNGEKKHINIPIELGKNNEFEYSVFDKSVILNFLKEIFSRSNINELTTKEKNISAEDLIKLMAFGTGDEELTKRFSSYNIDNSISKEKLLDIISIRTSIFLNRYQKYKKIYISDSITEQTIIDINENKSDLQGIEIEDKTKRVYNDARYISNIVGYTGVASSDENKENEENLIVGRMGIEKTMNDTLKSKDGIKTLYVDSTGAIIDEVKNNDPVKGNDIYLSIDLDFQKYIYDTIEDHLTKYYLDNMVYGFNYVKDVRELNGNYFISSAEIYNSLLTNGVINLSHLRVNGASKSEKNVYAAIKDKIDSIIPEIKNLLTNDKPLKDFDDSNYNYTKYFFKILQSDGVIMESKLNNNDETVNKWINYELSPKEYINYLLANGIINIEKIIKDGKYSSSDETIESLKNYIADTIKTDNGFIPLVTKELIAQRKIEGRDIINILYDQKFLAKDDNYNNFVKNNINDYEYLRTIIQKKILTPGTIAIDPFSASVVVDDPNTGKVLAMVSYPGYDSNKMEDSSYLSYIFNNKSAQLINRPTQLLKAPGSTFKPVTAFASLDTHITTPDEGILCTGVFDRVTPNIHCWIYPSSHGVLNVIGALANSCNVYFNEMGYRLGGKDTGTYNSTVGLNIIKKYASMFGLDRKTGVEIDESQPHISDDNAILSAIGQGSHLFNMSNLARYMSAIATNGKLYDLSLVDKIVHREGNEEKIPPKFINDIQLPQAEFDTIKTGLESVVQMSYNREAFANVGVQVAGKTGTAEEDLSRNNHSSFVGYAPASDPKVVSGIVIPNIGTNNEHINISGEILKYYFEHFK